MPIVDVDLHCVVVQGLDGYQNVSLVDLNTWVAGEGKPCSGVNVPHASAPEVRPRVEDVLHRQVRAVVPRSEDYVRGDLALRSDPAPNLHPDAVGTVPFESIARNGQGPLGPGCFDGHYVPPVNIAAGVGMRIRPFVNHLSALDTIVEPSG